MPLRKLPGVPIPLNAMTTSVGVSSPSPAAPHILQTVPTIRQDASNLCWAACCEMLLAHFSNSTFTGQCEMVEFHFGHGSGSCCISPMPTICNKAAWPARTMRKASLPLITSGPISFTEIKSEIQAGNPLLVYIYKNGPIAAHMVLLNGFDDQVNPSRVNVIDPSPTRSRDGRWLLNDVAHGFLIPSGRGAWLRTFRC